MGLQKGNPYKLINGIDYKDRVCGIDSDVKDRLKLYYLPTGSGVCIKKCPAKQNAKDFHCTDDAQKELDALPRSNAAEEALWVAKGYEMVKACNDANCAAAGSLRRCKCCAPVYPTNDVMNYCVSEQAQAVVVAAGDQAAQEAADATKPCDPTPPPAPRAPPASRSRPASTNYTPFAAMGAPPQIVVVCEIRDDFEVVCGSRAALFFTAVNAAL